MDRQKLQSRPPHQVPPSPPPPHTKPSPHPNKEAILLTPTLLRQIEHFDRAENTAFGVFSAEEAVLALFIDDGVPTRGHRSILLNTRFDTLGSSAGPFSTIKLTKGGADPDRERPSSCAICVNYLCAEQIDWDEARGAAAAPIASSGDGRAASESSAKTIPRMRVPYATQEVGLPVAQTEGWTDHSGSEVGVPHTPTETDTDAVPEFEKGGRGLIRIREV